jgi:hypothetical protein
MTTTSDMNEFSPEAKAKCAEIMDDVRHALRASRDLYKLLLLSGHIKDDQEYPDVINDAKFMIMLKDYLASNLEKDESDSLYGKGFISEYDLYWKVNTDQELCQYFKDKGLVITTDQMIMLKNNYYMELFDNGYSDATMNIELLDKIFLIIPEVTPPVNKPNVFEKLLLLSPVT